MSRNVACEDCGGGPLGPLHSCAPNVSMPQATPGVDSGGATLTDGPNDVGLLARRLFIETLEAQEQKGLAEYGRPLAASNGRDAFADLLAEMVDAWQYAVQARMERAALERELAVARDGLKSLEHVKYWDGEDWEYCAVCENWMTNHPHAGHAEDCLLVPILAALARGGGE